MTPTSNGNCSCDCVNCGRSAICPTCDKLLTWSEDGNVIRAGNYFIARQWPHGAVFENDEMLTLVFARYTFVENHLNAAKLACEIHARKMLGWEV